jgi:hypothetical protein
VAWGGDQEETEKRKRREADKEWGRGEVCHQRQWKRSLRSVVFSSRGIGSRIGCCFSARCLGRFTRHSPSLRIVCGVGGAINKRRRKGEVDRQSIDKSSSDELDMRLSSGYTVNLFGRLG